METNEQFIKIKAHIERLIQPAAAYYGLTPTQVCVLNIIRKSGSTTVSDIFKALEFNQGNMSSLCKKLEADGFIKKTKAVEDERKCYLSLTEKAHEALSGVDTIFSCSEDDCWLSKEEFERAGEAFEVLNATAKKINERLTAFLAEKDEGSDTNA